MSALPAQKQPVRRAPAPAKDDRARLIRLVHVGRRELGLDEHAYRAMLMAQAGVSSSSDASTKKLQDVVDFMKRQGFKIASKAPAAKSKVFIKSRQTGVTTAHAMAEAVVLASDPESRKVRAMWITLYEIGQVRDPSEAALLAYARRQTGSQRLEWIQDMVPVLEPLKSWLLRSMPQALNAYLRTPTGTWAGHMGPAWHENWQRSVTNLNSRLQRGLVQLVDEYVDLWQLVKSAREQKQ